MAWQETFPEATDAELNAALRRGLRDFDWFPTPKQVLTHLRAVWRTSGSSVVKLEHHEIPGLCSREEAAANLLKLKETLKRIGDAF